jgi:hypothetical protein
MDYGLWDDEPNSESMRGDRKIMRNPSSDQKKVRRAQQRNHSRADARPEENRMNFRQRESALLRAMASAKTLREQAVLAEELETLRTTRTAALQQEKDLDWADTVIRDTLSPVRSVVAHTTNSDWLDQVTPQNSSDAYSQMMAEASVWYNRVSPEVKSDREEFTIQAQGMARKLAGKFGEGSPQAARAFLDYAAFLLQREGASSLDQIEEIRDAKDNPKTTPLPQDVFDTFADPLAPGNQPGKPSTDNPLIQEILSDGGEGGGRPSEHDEGENLSNHYGPPPVQSGNSSRQASKGADEDPFGYLVSRSVALSYTGSLDDWRERLITEARAGETAKCQHCDKHIYDDGGDWRQAISDREGHAGERACSVNGYYGHSPHPESVVSPQQRQYASKTAGGTGSPNDSPPSKDPQKCFDCGSNFTAPNDVHTGYCENCRDGKYPSDSKVRQNKNRYDTKAGDSKKASLDDYYDRGLHDGIFGKPFDIDSLEPQDDGSVVSWHKGFGGTVHPSEESAIQNIHPGKAADCPKCKPELGGFNTKASYEVVGRYRVEGASSLMPAGPAHADNKDNPVNQGWEAADTDPAFPDVALPERQTTHPGNGGGGNASGGGGEPSHHDEGPGFEEGKDVKISKKDADGDELPDRRKKQERQDDKGAYEPKPWEEDDEDKKMAALAAQIRRFADMYGASDSEHKTVGEQREGENTENNDHPKKAKDVSNNGDMPNGAKDPKHKGGEGRPSKHTTGGMNLIDSATQSDAGNSMAGQPPMNSMPTPNLPGGNPGGNSNMPGGNSGGSADSIGGEPPNLPGPGGPGAGPGNPSSQQGGPSPTPPAPESPNLMSQKNLMASRDYNKAYKFAKTWEDGMPLVSTGSVEFEIGLYDGIKANSQQNRTAWISKHTVQAEKFPYLAHRLQSAARRTAALKKSAATDTDLNTIAPGAIPNENGNTPLSGPGRKPPLDGRTTR